MSTSGDSHKQVGFELSGVIRVSVCVGTTIHTRPHHTHSDAYPVGSAPCVGYHDTGHEAV